MHDSRSKLHENDKTNSAKGMPSAGGARGHQAAGRDRRGTFRSYGSIGPILFTLQNMCLRTRLVPSRPFCEVPPV